MKSRIFRLSQIQMAILLMWSPQASAEWSSWRGPRQNGVSLSRGLIETWLPTGENLLWTKPFSGRSTPIVLDNKVCVQGRAGEGVTEQEQVACFDAETGNMLWEHRFNVFHTTIPFNRVGWASPVGDEETGNIYAHGVQGMFICFSGSGRVLWSRSLTEEFGRISGYGGRTHTPVVDQELVIVSFLNLGWGDQIIPRHRYFAFDKTSGELVWVATPGGRPLDTTYSTPVVAEIGGRRLLIAGNADGGIYALDVHTGRTVWTFRLSKRGINSSVVVDSEKVYAAHSEENFDSTAMGRVVCIDASGSGDVTLTHELWRADGLQVGYSSPVVQKGRLYVVDNSANLHALDAATGEQQWTYNIGTVGRGSPVWADEKLFATEVNGGFTILDVGSEPALLDRGQIESTEGRPVEIFGSPAVANGRLYFASEETLYCLGNAVPSPTAPTPPSGQSRNKTKVESGIDAAYLQIVPSEVSIRPGQGRPFRVLGFDNRGRPLGEIAAEWATRGLGASMSGNQLTIDTDARGHGGTVVATANGLEAIARVRVMPELPWQEDFEWVELESNPAHWIGAGKKFKVQEIDGERVLVKPPAPRGLHRSNVYVGEPSLHRYTIQADLMGAESGRKRPDMGLINQRYTLDLMGNHQRLQVRSWASDLRMAKTMDFSWEPYVWYTVKMKVDVVDGTAIVRGKVWPREEEEPAAWTIEAQDPLPNETGSPGLYGYSASTIYFDNFKVW